MICRLPCAVAALLMVASISQAADWPQFRGIRGDGYADDATYPTKWDTSTNIRWKAKLPTPANSSPIVSMGRVFVTCGDARGRRRSLFCFDRGSGEQLWVRTVDYDKIAKTHKTNPYCGSTPAADGERVVVWHGSAGLFCYDFSGEQLWRRELGEVTHMWGYGSSPIIDGGKVFLNFGPGLRNYVTAIDLNTGETIWEAEEPHQGDGDRNEAGKYTGSWCTPVLTDASGTKLLICTMPTRVNAYNIETGAIAWTCEGIRGPRGDLAYSSPIIGEDFGFANGGFKGPAIGFRLDGSGDVTSTHQLWRTAATPQDIGSGVLVGKHIFKANAGPGTLQCIDALTGDETWQERSPAGNHWGSVVHAGGLLYVTGQEGVTVVFEPNPKQLEIVATNKLGEPSNATPACSDGEIFIRTASHLYCIAAGRE